MDWWKLFALLVAVASLHATAEGPKKKIRIHLPQKVKHIHHHKKIYITNHPAQSQYAPAFLPNAEGAMAVPTSVALPAAHPANLVPLNSVELYENSHSIVPGTVPAASKLLPLYRARGYYGPNHSEWNEQDYDLAPPPEPTDSYNARPPVGSASSNYPPKRVKILKVNDGSRKKVPRKTKPKRVVLKGRPEEEHPVSTFHEQFYSELDGTGTIKKIKKPPRVEKIIDGDTEHIHTYSEEHIHKLVYNDGPKFAGVIGVPAVRGRHAVRGFDHVPSMSALAAARPLLPVRSPLLAYPPSPYAGLTAVGSMGTPAHLEYAAYNAHDVTHDHIFHDHGEIPSDHDFTKEDLSYPPKASYTSQGLRINGNAAHFKPHVVKSSHKGRKPSASSDFSYYESIYAPSSKSKNIPKPTNPTPYYGSSSEVNFDDFEPLSSFKVKNKSKLKSRYIAPTQHNNKGQYSDYRAQEASVPAPFSLSSTVVHDYKPKTYSGSAQAQAGFTNFKDPFVDFKGSYSNNFEYDTYAASTNVHASENKESGQNNKSNKKSVSTQNFSFGKLSHQGEEDPMDFSEYHTPISQEVNEGFEAIRSTESTMATPYTIKETSPAHKYYKAMAAKALQSDPLSVPEASNNHYQYVEAPTTSVPFTSSVATTPTALLVRVLDEALTIKPSERVPDTRQAKRRREKNLATSKTESKYSEQKEFQSPSQAPSRAPHSLRHVSHKYAKEHATETTTVRGKVKYGDKI